MRVSLNGYFVSQPNVGSGQYALHLLQCIRGAEVDVARPIGALGNLGKLRWEQFGWPAAARAAGVELLHSPYFALPLRRDRPAVVTIHDLIPMVLPAYRGSLQVRAYTWLQALACRTAQAILVDSEHSQQDVLRLLRVPPERVHVVYLGVEPRFTPDRSGPSPLDEPYIFYIGGWELRKNVPALIAAFERVVAERPDVVLAIAGAARSGSAMFPDLQALAAPLGDRVRFLGFVSEQQKLELYRHAELFAYPSLYEGFGLNPLEALACGCPVVSSDASCLPEIVGDAGLLVDARSPESLADGMLRALADPEPWRAKGPAQAAKFSWQRMADETAAIYRQVLDTSR
jgi:glycosyltransferase involved in cell wall biosynthesis